MNPPALSQPATFTVIAVVGSVIAVLVVVTALVVLFSLGVRPLRKSERD
jgi:hypothetical protein